MLTIQKKEKQDRVEAIKIAYKYYNYLYIKQYENAGKLISNPSMNITQYINEQKKYEKEYGVLKNSLLFYMSIMQDNSNIEYKRNYYYLTFKLEYDDSMISEILIIRKNRNTGKFSIYEVRKYGKVEKGNLEKYLQRK